MRGWPSGTGSTPKNRRTGSELITNTPSPGRNCVAMACGVVRIQRHRGNGATIDGNVEATGTLGFNWPLFARDLLVGTIWLHSGRILRAVVKAQFQCLFQDCFGRFPSRTLLGKAKAAPAVTNSPTSCRTATRYCRSCRKFVDRTPLSTAPLRQAGSRGRGRCSHRPA